MQFDERLPLLATPDPRMLLLEGELEDFGDQQTIIPADMSAPVPNPADTATIEPLDPPPAANDNVLRKPPLLNLCPTPFLHRPHLQFRNTHSVNTNCTGN